MLDQDQPHKRFTVGRTSIRLAMPGQARTTDALAIHYQPAPTKVEGGTSHSLRFPILAATPFLANAETVLADICRILEDAHKPTTVDQVDQPQGKSE